MVLIKLKSSDDQIFKVDQEVAFMSNALKDMIEHLGVSEDDSEPIPIQNVSSTTLAKVLKWAEHHKDDAVNSVKGDEKGENSSDDISEWDADFLKVDQSSLFEIILAANYLDMKGLLDISCKAVAGMIRGKTPDEIRKHFNITNDFTPEEEDQIRRENEWCEEK